MAPCSEESCRVFSAHYIVAFLRGCAVLASRRELQNKGVLEPDCPVCLDMLAAGNGVVTFHILECGHRCEAVAAVRLLTTTQPPHGRVFRCQATTPTRALPLRASQDPQRVPAQDQEEADPVWRGAHVPALPSRVAHKAHL